MKHVRAMGILMGALMASSALASWLAVSLEDHLPHRPLVVVGEIKGIDRAPDPEPVRREVPHGDGVIVVTEHRPPERGEQRAHLIVQRVLKNETKVKVKAGDDLALLMPARMVFGTDIIYKDGTKAVWLLRPVAKGYAADHYRDRTSLDDEEKVVKAIEANRAKKAAKH